MKKRILSAMLAFIMILTVSAVGYVEAEELIIYNDFENEISSSVWTGDYEIDGGVNRYIKSAPDKTQFYYRPGKTIDEGAVVVSYDVMIPQNASVRIKQLWDNSNKRPYFIIATAAGKLTVNNTQFAQYTAGEWFNLTEIADIESKTVELYLDGEYIGEFGWHNNGEASGINNIQTQYDKNTVYIDNAYVESFADKQTAKTAFKSIFLKKVKLENKSFSVLPSSTVQNSITPVKSGTQIISYDMKFDADMTSGVRLMQIYDNTLSAGNRTLLIQTSSNGTISVNEKPTGYIWDNGSVNNITVIFNADKKESTVYYNGENLGTYGVYKANATDIARIDTQNDMGSNTVLVSDVWAKSFVDDSLALKYYNSVKNISDDSIIEYYNKDKNSILKTVDEYNRDLDSMLCSEEKQRNIVESIWDILPYTQIFLKDFDNSTNLCGYTVADNVVTENKMLKLTNSGKRARLLKTVSGYESFISEFEFMQDSVSNIDSIVRITNRNGDKEAVRIFAQNNNIVLRYGKDDTYEDKVILKNYSENQWYKIKLHTDLRMKKSYVYLDGVFKGVYDFTSADIENLDRVFDTFTDALGTYYIDNIKVYRDENFIVDSHSDINIPVKISDNSGVGVKTRLFRRGFALEEGCVFDEASLSLTDKTGVYIPSDFSVMERYSDGSAKWVLLSFTDSLCANEEKELYIVNSQIEKTYGSIAFNDGILSNERISIDLTQNGINDIKLDGKTVIEDLSLYYNDTKLPFTNYDILQENELYVKIRLNAASDGTMCGEMYVTLWQNGNDADFEYRLTALKDVTVTDMGCEINAVSGSECSVGAGIAEVKNENTSIAIASQDVERFAGAVSENCGFFVEENTLLFEPIINDTEFVWYDGLSRTNHFTLTADKADEVLENLKNPASVIISPEQFKKSHIVDTVTDNAILYRIADSLHYAYDKRNGCFEAGYIPWLIDKAKGKIEASSTQHGETDYNIALLQLIRGDNLLYNMICESGECRADVSVYKGGLSDAYGAVRYKTGSHLENGGQRFKTSHPYYGEASGLYMAYMLSGNEYLKETFIDVVDHIYTNTENGVSEAGKYPTMISWSDGTVKKMNYGESRYMIQIRPLMMASAMTGDNKYRDAAYHIVEWAKNTQSDKGFWYQAYFNDKSPLVQNGQTEPAVKNYIMLYGARGLSYLADVEESPEVTGVLEKFCDFLCSEIETYGSGLWSPTGDIDLYEENEDGTRGKSAMQDIMAAEVLFKTYQKTGNEKYLDGFLSCINAWVCALGPNGLPASNSYLKGYYDGSVGSAQASQNLTVISFIGEIEKFMADNKELVYKKGFGQLLEVFGAWSVVSVPQNISGHSYPELTSSIYNDKAFFVMNVNGAKSGNYYKKYTSTVLGKNLFTGFKNIVSSNGNVSLNAQMEQFDVASGIKCPIMVSGNKSSVDVYVDEYNQDKIVIRLLTDEKVNICIKDGVFDTDSGYYSYDVEKADNTVTVTVINTQNGLPKLGEINIESVIYPVNISSFRLLDSFMNETKNMAEAMYISDIELTYNEEVKDVDLFAAQYYNENGGFEAVDVKNSVSGIEDVVIDISLDTSVCKLMVWDKMKPVSACVKLEGLK